MKVQLNRGGAGPHFTGYGEGYVSVAGQRYEHPLVLAPGQGVQHWTVGGFDAVTPAHFEALLQAHAPEVVVFGTGAKLRFPAAEVSRVLLRAGVGLEVMDTPAACRTYNILLSEDRRVVAAILLE